MADLRAILESLGHAHVRTYIQSGNAIFTTDASGEAGAETALASAIRAGIADRVGLEVDVIVRSRDDLAEALAAVPFRRPPEAAAHRVPGPDPFRRRPARARIDRGGAEPPGSSAGPPTSTCRTGSAGACSPPQFERRLKVRATARNLGYRPDPAGHGRRAARTGGRLAARHQGRSIRPAGCPPTTGSRIRGQQPSPTHRGARLRCRRPQPHRVTVIPGDGVGPEVVRSAVRIIAAQGVRIDWEEAEAGAEVFKQGDTSGVPPATRESIERTGVVLKGPLETPVGFGEKSANVTLRKLFETYANVRPARELPGVPTRYAGEGVDMIVVRENVEDLYAGIEHMLTPDVGQCLKIISRKGSERVIRYAFELARREGRGRSPAPPRPTS